MGLLAEANGTAPGRWVLMPRKGVRFKDPHARRRARSRRRRRQVFMVLLEATGLSLLIGLFPPLRLMLIGTGALAFLLLVYIGLLIMIRAHELERARRARGVHDGGVRPRQRVPSVRIRASAPGGPDDNRGTRPVPHARGKRPDDASNGNGNGNGGDAGLDEEELRELGIRIIEGGCHVTIRTPEQVEAEALRSLA